MTRKLHITPVSHARTGEDVSENILKILIRLGAPVSKDENGEYIAPAEEAGAIESIFRDVDKLFKSPAWKSLTDGQRHKLSAATAHTLWLKNRDVAWRCLAQAMTSELNRIIT